MRVAAVFIVFMCISVSSCSRFNCALLCSDKGTEAETVQVRQQRDVEGVAVRTEKQNVISVSGSQHSRVADLPAAETFIISDTAPTVPKLRPVLKFDLYKRREGGIK